MARGFGATVGTGSTDVITMSSLTTVPTILSASFWVQQFAQGDHAQRLFSWQTSGNAMVCELFYGGSADERLYFQRDFTTTDGEWRTDLERSTVLQNWTHVVLTYDSGSTANNPSLYVNGESLTMNETSTPAGSATGTPADFRLGNRRAGDRVLNAHMMDFALWSGAELNQTNVDLLLTGDTVPTDITQTSLTQENYYPLTDDLNDDWGSDNGSGTGVVTQGNPLFMHNVWTDAGGGGGISIPVAMHSYRRRRARV